MVQFNTKKGVCKFISVVNTTSLNLKDVNFIKYSYTNKDHLLVLLEKKVTTMTKKTNGRIRSYGFQIPIEESN